MLSLTLTADLSGVTDLRPDDTPEDPFWYTFKVQCTSCREVHPNWVNVSRFEMNEMSGSRGEANFVWKCKMCKRESSATIMAPPISYQQESPPKAQKVIDFDCRGLEFIDFKPEGDWLVTGIDSGTKFEAINFEEGDWYEYDEKAGDEPRRSPSTLVLDQYTHNTAKMSVMPVNPRPMLQSLVNEEVVVRLKWGQTEYKGILVSIDSYMNIQLTNTEEFIDQKLTAALGQVLIRCNNVLWIQAAPTGKEGGGDTKMEG
ncbi:hypothetical protein V499_08702 [Pseudogymnoascus sp. VKM F-103]|nr:hypothetical protein V499_08702 [Pseudogymnoascus sp. VKM F-103]